MNKKKLSETHPHLATQWYPAKNGDLTPNDVTAGSDKKVWWKCDKGHEWVSEPYHRCGGGRDCPYCACKKVCKDNCLSVLFPDVTAEWHSVKNGHLKPDGVVAGSSRRVWWICERGHEWEASVRERTGHDKTKCPYCSGRRLCYDNCLEKRFPVIAAEWHPVKNGSSTPRDVVAMSRKMAWWLCKRGHEYEKLLCERTHGGTGCPYCAGWKVCDDNCLATLYPNIAAEWHPTKNGGLTPKDVVAGSSKRVWWQCKKGHEWRTVVACRSSSGCGCPICKESKGERRISQILDMMSLSYQRQCKFELCKNRNPLPFDFSIVVDGQVKLIEYQGEQHYIPCAFGGKPSKAQMIFARTQKHDTIKRDWCKINNIPLLEIPYWEYDNIERMIKDFS